MDLHETINLFQTGSMVCIVGTIAAASIGLAIAAILIAKRSAAHDESRPLPTPPPLPADVLPKAIKPANDQGRGDMPRP